MSDDDHEGLDDLTRDELAERDGPGYAVACVLDEWKQRLHGLTSSDHGAGLFLDLLAIEGWRVERIEVPSWPVPAGPIHVSYLSGASDEESERARLAVIETALGILNEQSDTPGRLPTVTVGQESTPEYLLVLHAYREAHRQPTAGMPAIPTAAEVNQAVTWWNEQQRGQHG